MGIPEFVLCWYFFHFEYSAYSCACLILKSPSKKVEILKLIQNVFLKKLSLTVQNQIGPIAEVPSESLGKGNCFTHEIPRKVSSAQPDAKDYQTSDETTPWIWWCLLILTPGEETLLFLTGSKKSFNKEEWIKQAVLNLLSLLFAWAHRSHFCSQLIRNKKRERSFEALAPKKMLLFRVSPIRNDNILPGMSFLFSFTLGLLRPYSTLECARPKVKAGQKTF